MTSGTSAASDDKYRLDKWLWAARFFKTRSLAAEAIGKGHVWVNDLHTKSSRSVKVGDRIQIRQGPLRRTLIVENLSLQRGPATVAQQLYQETLESIAAREQWQAQWHLNRDPADHMTKGRPTKRDRRQLEEALKTPSDIA